jgi:hypothetical protein
MDAVSLDQIAVLEATDKSSVDHDYARHYERAFGAWGDEPIELLEIGVADGASLRMWERMFSRAKLIGVDIIPECVTYAGGRKYVEIGSQIDPVFLAGLLKKYRPTIIIDDGSHVAEHVIFSFEHLFGGLLPGGCYVMEDLHYHLDWGGSRMPIGPLKLVQDLALWTTAANRDAAGWDSGYAALLRSIDRIEFIRHAVLIWKKPAEDTAQAIVNMKALVEKSGSARNWFFFVHYVTERGGPLEEAIFAARKAIELGDTSGLSHWRLSEVLDSNGDFVAALAAAEQALVLQPDNIHLRRRIDGLKAKLRL